MFFVRFIKTDKDRTKKISEESHGLLKELRGVSASPRSRF